MLSQLENQFAIESFIMKILILSGLLAGLPAKAYAQGHIALDNNANTSTSPTATANGLFFLSTGGVPEPISQDFNAAFYVGASSNSLALIRTFLLSDATAT